MPTTATGSPDGAIKDPIAALPAGLRRGGNPAEKRLRPFKILLIE
jgi:hypothetical protein